MATRTIRSFGVLSILAAAPAVFGQSVAPSFEVASIKQQVLPTNAIAFSMPNSNPIRIAGNRVTMTASLQKLVLAAYNLNDNQIAGGPDWAKRQGGDPYEIAATVGGDAPPALDRVRLMLQTLLAGRFQLKFHRETKDLPVDDLVIAKSGLKMKATAADAQPRPQVDARTWPRGASMWDQSQTMAELARGLSLILDRPVSDKTSLAGKYDVKMQYATYLRQLAPPGVPTPEEESGLAPLPQALEEQLGLKLLQAREPTEILVIDRVERPSEN